MVNPVLVESIRHAVEEITNHGPSVALAVVEPLRAFTSALAHVGRDGLTDQEKAEWYAGQLISMADNSNFTGFPALSLALDKFVPAPKVSVPAPKVPLPASSGVHPLDPPFVKTSEYLPEPAETDNAVRKLYGEGRAEEVSDTPFLDVPCEGDYVLHLDSGVAGKVVKIFGANEYTPPAREGDENPKVIDAAVVKLDSGDAFLLGDAGTFLVLNIVERSFVDGFIFALGATMLGAGLMGDRMNVKSDRAATIIGAILTRQAMMLVRGDV